MGRLGLAVVLGAALVIGPAAQTAASSATIVSAGPTNPLTAVADLGKGHFRFNFKLPADMEPYGVEFFDRAASFINSRTNLSIVDSGIRATSTRVWTVTSFPNPNSNLVLAGHASYNVRLLYAAKRNCKPGIYPSGAKYVSCTHVLRSPALTLNVGTVGNLGPGRLIGRSSGSGIAGTASVDNDLPVDQTDVTVRVNASPGQNVVIDWNLTCDLNFAIQSRSGSSQEATPVNDNGLVIFPPSAFSGAKCSIEVTAGLLGDGGSLNLAVYDSAT